MRDGPLETCWTLVLDAAAGEPEARARFAERYLAPIEAYLGARWRANRRRDAIPDAVQEVFVEVYKAGGLLDKVQPGLPGGFRAFLYGAVRRVAMRFEEGRGAGREQALPTGIEESDAVVHDPHLSQIFDRAWAMAMMQQAARGQHRAARGDSDRQHRVELLRLRFEDGLPIRAIAERWGEAPERVHKAYARARDEFREALLEVLAEHHDDSASELEQRAKDLLAALG